MNTMSIPFKTLAKSGAALVVSLGLVTQLLPAPVQAGSKTGAFIGGVAVGVGTAIILNEAAKNNRRRSASAAAS